MSERGLEDAVRALRDEAWGPPAPADATRMRVLGTVRVRRRRRLMALRTTAVLLAAAIGGAAWAAATGRLPPLASLSGYVGEALSTDRDPESAAPGQSGLAGAVGEPGQGNAGNAGGESSAAEAPSGQTTGSGAAAGGVAVGGAATRGAAAGGAATGDAATRGAVAGGAETGGAATGGAAAGGAAAGGGATGERPRPDSGAPGAPGAGAAPSDTDAAADALYQRAHALHFQAGSWSAARAAWDAYLAAAPRGRFATFAHYNRALCLLRLGRTAEARSALALFASGAFGGYRRAEAQSLLDALNAPSAWGAPKASEPPGAGAAGGAGGEKR